MKTMTVFGVGPKWGVLTLSYAVAATWVSLQFSVLRMDARYSPLTLTVGIACLAVGLPFYALAGRTIVKGFPTGGLMAGGVYAVCRHPVYGSWIVFILPGIACLCRSWLSLTASVVGYLLLRIMARAEESYLSEKFGETYRAYRECTPFVLPVGVLHTRGGRERPH